MTENFDIKIIDFARTVLAAANKQVIKKLVLSKSTDASVQRTVLILKSISGKACLQAESFYTDNKAKHENIALEGAIDRLCELISGYLQANLITTVGDCELKASKSGKITLIGVGALEKKIGASDESARADIGGNNNDKKYLTSKSP